VAVALLLVLAPVVIGLLHALPWSPGEAASSTLTCSVKACCDAGEVAVFRMSGLTNAHAGTPGGSGYANVVCCGGPAGLSASCSGYYDTVLTLSSADNAHVASDGGYTTQVCLSSDTGMDCRYGATCGAGYACLVTISGTTNAHVADCDGSGDYPTKVCCAAQAAPPVGGIAELPAVGGAPGTGASGMGGATYAVLAGAAAGVLAFAVLATLSVKRRGVR
jgi:hypothetical protein